MKISDYSKEELEEISTIYDIYWPLILKLSKDPTVFSKLRSIISKILDKNREKLQTNIVGRQVLINFKDEVAILDVLSLTHAEVKNTIKDSPYFQKFGELKLQDQLVFAIPLILLSLAYKKQNKEEEAKFIYLTAFLKPYASRESYHFGKYPVNEDQMLYTIENLSERLDLKKGGTIFSVLLKMSASSYQNYYGHANMRTKFSDRELHVIYSSGIASRINGFFVPIWKAYSENKGKYLAYENSSVTFEDDDGTDYTSRDIESDSAVRTKIVSAVLTKVNREPIDLQLLKIAAQAAQYNIRTSEYGLNTLRTAIEGTIENMSSNMGEFFTCIISSFLFSVNPNTERKYTGNDIKTPIFLAVMSKKIYSSPNSQDKNILRVRELLEKMLENYCDVYENGKVNTRNRNIKNGLFFYWITLIQKAAKHI